jgi:tripartite-type tricarboxylate transporter receptor subunit TctC
MKTLKREIFMTLKRHSTLAAIAVAALAGMAALPAQSARLADTYKGKTVKILFGFSVGGTYGQYSLMMSEFLGRHIPGNPTVIIQSMPGAGGLKASNFASTVMSKEGLSLFMPPDSIVVNQLLRPKGVRYKANEFTWLGNAIESNSIIAVTKKSGVRSWEDVMKREVIMASTGKGSQTNLVPMMLNGVFDARFKVIMGYKGSRGSTHAMELGEAQGVSLTWLTLKKNRGNWFDDSDYPTKALPIIQVGYTKEADLPNVPMASELAKTEEDRQIVNFIASLGPIGRGLTTPPGAPKALTAGLRKSFDAMMQDNMFLASAEKRKLRIQPKSGAEVQAIVNDIMKIKPATVARARIAIFGK